MKTVINNRDVEITGEKSDLALSSSLFKKWAENLKGFTIFSIDFQSVDTVMRKGKEEVLFLKLKAKIENYAGEEDPGIAFLRGASVGILIVLETEKEEYAVLIKSAQPAIGMVSYVQLPAGMMDNETDAWKVAEREMMEETGIDPKSGTMNDLTKEFFGATWKGIYPSSGACDEFVKLFLFRKKVTEEELKSIEGRKTGLVSEHEHITLKLVKLEDLFRATPDVKAHSAYIMYIGLKKKGELYDTDRRQA